MATVPFQWDDPLQLETQLTEEERMVRDSIRAYAEEKLMPRVIKANREETFDAEVFKDLGDLGVYGASIPEAEGGSGLNHVCYGLTARELERVDSAYRSTASVQCSLVIHPIHAFGSDEQKKKYLPKLISGDAVGCFGLTEPDQGSDPGGMKTRADKADGGYVLNGNKMWISNAPAADVFVVWGKLDGVIRGFILEKGMKGLSAPKMEGKLSLRASVTGEIVMNN
ncbi:MAG: acyl-CoA dehydrogenase family protein, partial [Alphaproteobacteria bacterium]